MKAIKLFLKNVGPFYEETVDFSRLEGLFLITGDTGSGKTFIFDAITYALYDTTCGIRGVLNNNMLISRNRKADEDSYVVFTFAVGGVYYRVKRYLERVTRPTTVRAVLEISHDDGKSFEVKSEKAEVKKDVLEILKLTAEEFSKIVLLPQGQFEEFLTSNSEKKKEILKKMFNVEKFSKIVEEIKVQEKKFADDMASLDKLNAQFSQGKSLEELEKELESGLKNISDLTKEEKKINKKITSLTVEQNSLNEEKKTSEKKAECESLLKSEKEKSSEIKTLEHNLELAKKADLLAGVLKDKQNSVQNLTEKKIELEIAEKKFSEAEKDFEESLVMFKKIPDMEERGNTLSGEIAVLKDKLKKAKEYEKVNKIYEDVKKNSQFLKSEQKKVEKSLADVKKMLPDGKNADEYILLLLSEKNNLSVQLKEAEKNLEKSNQYKSLSEELLSLESEIGEKSAFKTQTDSLLAEKEKLLETARIQSKIAGLMAQAASLAAKLEEGVPCPVCGSKNHPHPAVSELSFDYEKQAEELEKEIKILERKKSDNEIALNSLKFKYEETKKMFDSLGECPSVSDAENKLKDIKQKYESCLEKYDEAEELKKKIRVLEEEYNSVSEKLNEAELNFTQAETAWKMAQKDLGENLSVSAVEEKYSLISKQYDELTEKIAELRKNHSESSTLKAETSAYLEASRKGADDAEKLFKTAEKAFADKLSENPEFDSEKSIEEALLPLKEQKSIEKEIFSHKEKLLRLETQLLSFGEIREASVIEKEAEKVSAEKNKLSCEAEEISVKLMELNGNCRLLDSSIKEINKNSKKIADIQKKHRCYQYLKQKFSYKTQLDTWALGAYYSRIVDFASQRFEKLSGGRYRLKQNMDFHSGRANSDTSLDLLVEDTYFGKYSEIASLSGGERFEASLSLALALTDSVKSRKGGIELDSIFIDEGFGTLDSKTRNLIKPVLEDLQVNQKKTVGIISHVEAFQEEISNQIQLIKSESGTHVKIVKK